MFRSKKEAEESLKQEELLRDKMKPLAEYLLREKEQVVYVSNVAVAKNRGLLDGRWDKNDKKDAPMSLICQARAAASSMAASREAARITGPDRLPDQAEEGRARAEDAAEKQCHFAVLP